MTRFDSARIWVNKWGRIIFGTWLLAVSLYLVPVSLDVRATGRDQEHLAKAAKKQAEAIQTERAEGYRLNCYKQNARNRVTKIRLRERTQDRQAIESTDYLIDGLQPVEDCDDLAKSRVRSR